MKYHQWYMHEDGSPKAHRRPRVCKECRENPHGACLLPFRKTRKTRWLEALDKKPMFYKSLWLRNWLKRTTAHLEYDYGMDSDRAKTMANEIGG